ncbi:hypothetical protein BH23GEM6_BH23GEM6_11960 [soil metagenome]
MLIARSIRRARTESGYSSLPRWFPVALVAVLAGGTGCAPPPPAGVLSTAAAPGEAASSRVLGPGVTHRYISRAEGPWAIHVVEVDLQVCGIRIRSAKGGEEIIGRETTSAIAARYTAEGAPVLAAVNADFFRYEPDGVPEGPQVAGGEVVAAAGTFGPSVSTRFGIPQPVFGITRSGRAFVGEAALVGQAWKAGGTFPLGRVNAAPGRDSLAIFNRFAGGRVEGEQENTQALLQVITRGQSAGDAARAVVLRVGHSAEPLLISENTRVLSGSGRAAAWLGELAAGDTVNWHLSFSGAPGAVVELVGGFPLLILDGEPVLHRVPAINIPFSQRRHPRTAVGIRADGIVLLVIVDGRQEGYSAGMSLPELTDLLLELGAIDAINLDGGGSTALVTDRGIVNRPSDAEERPVSNALLVQGPAAGECGR